MKPFFSNHDHAGLERRLRAGAAAFGPVPPSGLRGSILAALRCAEAQPGESVESVESMTSRADPRGTWLAAAAAVLVLASAWVLTRGGEARPAGERTVVALSRGILGAGSLVLALPGQVEDNLRLEAARLLADTTRVAEGLVRGLPAPLRSRFERM